MRSEYKNSYKGAVRFITLNDGDGVEKDKDLTPIILRLPKPPKDLTKLKNYGLHPDEQVYIRDEIPAKLKNLEKRAIGDLEEANQRSAQNSVTGHKLLRRFWGILEDELDDYEREIIFIKQTIWKTVYGEWIYLDGIPTYITPWHYFYLNFWSVPDVLGGHPEFRVRDWKAFLFNWYLYNTTETFTKVDEEGNAEKEADGSYRMRDTGRRVFYGSIQPKNRRSGATHMSLNIIWSIITKSVGKHGTMISKSVLDSEDHWNNKLIPTFQSCPFFLKPTWDGNNDPSDHINFKAPSNDYSYRGLGSSIFYPKSVSEGVIDSQKIAAALFDEQGKATGGGRVDVFERWEVSKQTMSQGNGAIIEGFCLNPSTCEEMEDGAVNYKAMCDLSNFYTRLDSGQTKSGLALLYFPAQVGLEGFIGPFGESVIQDPTERQIRLSSGANQVYVKEEIGSRQYLSSERERLLKSGTPADMRKYRSLRRKHPMYYAESWVSGQGGMGFSLEVLEKRQIELNRLKVLKQGSVKRGNFMWSGGVKDGRVEWVSDPDNGKFEISIDLIPVESSQKVSTMYFDPEVGRNVPSWEPVHKSRFTLGVDPFVYGAKKKKGDHNISAQSDGGIIGLHEFDPAIDTGVDPLEWKSRRFILAYRNRPQTVEEFDEDVIMAAVYFGAMIFLERNVSGTWQHIVKRGFGSYLKYDIDPLTAKRMPKPGYFATKGSLNDGFGLLKDFILQRGHTIDFVELIDELKTMNDPSDLGARDLVAAAIAALLGSRSGHGRLLDFHGGQQMNMRNSTFFRKRRI